MAWPCQTYAQLLRWAGTDFREKQTGDFMDKSRLPSSVWCMPVTCTDIKLSTKILSFATRHCAKQGQEWHGCCEATHCLLTGPEACSPGLVNIPAGTGQTTHPWQKTYCCFAITLPSKYLYYTHRLLLLPTVVGEVSVSSRCYCRDTKLVKVLRISVEWCPALNGTLIIKLHKAQRTPWRGRQRKYKSQRIRKDAVKC